MSNAPLVTAIIPTHRRPELAVRAARSALSQTLRDIEVLVLLDGPNVETEQALAAIHDSRLRTIGLPTNIGVSAVRNHGVAEARAGWIALLDDDDEWLPRKLELQLRRAQESTAAFPLVSCRFVARTPHADMIWPRRLPDPGERLDEYLFCQRDLLAGGGMVLPTTLFMPAELARRVPFDAALRRHQDIDWLIKAAEVSGCTLLFASPDEPLAVWNLDDSIPRMSNTADWQDSRSWAIRNRARLSRRAIAGFLLTWASLAAARRRKWKAFFQLPLEAFRSGSPRFIDMLAHVSIWLIPGGLRRRLSAAAQRSRS